MRNETYDQYVGMTNDLYNAVDGPITKSSRAVRRTDERRAYAVDESLAPLALFEKGPLYEGRPFIKKVDSCYR